MAYKASAPKKKRLGKPVYCPGCLIVLPLRYDKNDNPFFRCPICALTIFMGSAFAQTAFMMLQAVIAKAPERWKDMVRKNVSALTKSEHARKMQDARREAATPTATTSG